MYMCPCVVAALVKIACSWWFVGADLVGVGCCGEEGCSRSGAGY
jgi:hypothetical protein